MPHKKSSLPEEHPLFHDTYRLLRSYRDVRWSVDVSCSDLQAEFREAYGVPVDNCIDQLVSLGADLQGTNIESHARTIVRSRKMLALMDSAVEMMRMRHKKGELYYWILFYSFLSSQEYPSTEEIIKQLDRQYTHMSRRTYYVYRQEAIDVLSSVLWGYTTRECNRILSEFDLGQ